MKRFCSFALIICLMLSLLAACGAGGKDTAGTTEPVDSQTTEAAVQGQLSFNHEAVTLVTAGETMGLYNGSVPVDLITWGSDNEAVATFDKGIVTAVSNGETVVYAQYQDSKVSCTVRCNLRADTQPTEATQATTEPTQAPTTEPTTPADGNGGSAGGSREPVLMPGAAVVDSSFFDDAVFIGDSISLKLSYYASSSGELGKAKFLVVGSYGVSNAINDHPDTKLTYQGTTYVNFEEALAATGAKKLFVMLGMNDIGLYGIDKTIENWGTMLDMIRQACPGMSVYIQSMTPVWTGGEKGSLKNANVEKYNARLKEFAQSNGCVFIDIAPYMKDATGGLATKFCSDSYVHLTDEGARTWIKALKAFGGY